MNSEQVMQELNNLTTAHIADGCLRTGQPIRFGPTSVVPLTAGMKCFGPALPVRHVGSIDIFFEALEQAEAGQVMVIDNGGRQDEACIGDIVALEVQAAGLTGIVIWGLHRDAAELADIGFPVFTMGSLPTGPQRLHVRPNDVFTRATFGLQSATKDDFVFADANGIMFVAQDRLAQVVEAAVAYRDREAVQLQAIRSGKTYREQVQFSTYVSRRAQEPQYGFRQHLKDIEAAGEV